MSSTARPVGDRHGPEGRDLPARPVVTPSFPGRATWYGSRIAWCREGSPAPPRRHAGSAARRRVVATGGVRLLAAPPPAAGSPPGTAPTIGRDHLCARPGTGDPGTRLDRCAHDARPVATAPATACAEDGPDALAQA